MFLNTQHSWSIVVAKFSKTKFPCNSTAYGFKTLFFINWSRGFCRYACINSLIVVCRSFDSAFLDLTPTQKQKLEVAKSSRNCNAPNLCNLQFYYVDMQTEFYSPAIFCITLSMQIDCPLDNLPHQQQPYSSMITSPSRFRRSASHESINHHSMTSPTKG